MELYDYIAANSVVMIRVPRFVASSKLASMLGVYLTKNGIHVLIPDASVLVKFPTQTFDCIIYESPEYYSPEEKANAIILFGWGDNESTVGDLIKKHFPILRLDDSTFSFSKRDVNYRTIPIKVSPEVKKWHSTVEKSNLPDEVKQQAGNYTYTGHSSKEELEVMSKVKQLSSDVLPFQKDIRLIGDFSPNLPPTLKTLSGVSVDRNIQSSSPKLSVLFQEFVKKPGKYVVFTNYSKAYGANLIATIAQTKYNLPIRRLNHTDDIEEVTNAYNEASQEILITCRLPINNLIGVALLVFIDAYDAQLITSMIQKCYPDNTDPLHVVLIYQMETKEEERAKKELENLKRYESIYTSFDEFPLVQKKGDGIVILQ